jgi:nitrite reductase/ring-hydroxylating ferredoxin subunit
MTEAMWVKVVPAINLDEGAMVGVEIGDLQIAVYKVDGEFYATDNVCTHAFALLTDGFLEGDVVECPLHAGCFNVKTGKGLGEPIFEDIRSFSVRVSDGIVEVEIP